MKNLVSKEILTSQFFLLCLSAALFMASFNMIIPELPEYLTKLGGKEYKGLIISLFAASAMISRPFSGKLADAIGRKPVMIFGALASAVCGAFYPFLLGLTGFFILRFLHGLSAGFQPTGSTAFLADLVPPSKRGEALGFLGMSSSAGMAAGPAIGSAVAMRFGLDAMFYVSSVSALLSILIVAWMKETGSPSRFKVKMLRIEMSDILDKTVMRPAIFMLLTVYSFGMVLTIIPDYSEFLNLQNKGLFFSIMLVASVVTRLFAGRASDRIGRIATLKIGALLLIVSMALIAFAPNIPLLIAGAIVYGMATGVNSPTVFAWTVDLADEAKRGRAMATLFIFLELGILLGALISAEIYANDSERFKWAFLSGSSLALLALAILQRYGRDSN